SASPRNLAVRSVEVSRNVSGLERDLGVRLLARSTRKLALTEEGRLFYARCIGPLRELEGARAAARERIQSASGTVRVTSITPFGLSYVLPLIPAFTARYPNIEIEFHLDDTVSDMISQGYDVGIRVGGAPGKAVITRLIPQLHFVVCGSPAYLARHAPPQTPTDLLSHNCLRLRHRGNGRILGWTLTRK